MKASDFCDTAAGLISGDRNATHGEAGENHANIAALWNAYLQRRFGTLARVNLTARDAMLMMSLFKIARTMTGRHNPDDYVDGIGYLALAGADAEKVAALATHIQKVETENE